MDPLTMEQRTEHYASALAEIAPEIIAAMDALYHSPRKHRRTKTARAITRAYMRLEKLSLRMEPVAQVDFDHLWDRG